jgi:hypothetical protein
MLVDMVLVEEWPTKGYLGPSVELRRECFRMRHPRLPCRWKAACNRCPCPSQVRMKQLMRDPANDRRTRMEAATSVLEEMDLLPTTNPKSKKKKKSKSTAKPMPDVSGAQKAKNMCVGLWRRTVVYINLEACCIF